MSDDNPKPISDEHKAFARALVALAREHGSSMLKVEFRLSSSKRFRADTSDWTVVHLGWAEGRHGVDSTLSLRAEAHETIREKEA